VAARSFFMAGLPLMQSNILARSTAARDVDAITIVSVPDRDVAANRRD
jgi:hypothetical protein